jgi:hypothetical protein
MSPSFSLSCTRSSWVGMAAPCDHRMVRELPCSIDLQREHFPICKRCFRLHHIESKQDNTDEGKREVNCEACLFASFFHFRAPRPAPSGSKPIPIVALGL